MAAAMRTDRDDDLPRMAAFTKSDRGELEWRSSGYRGGLEQLSAAPT
jgi:hypothetical protein